MIIKWKIEGDREESVEEFSRKNRIQEYASNMIQRVIKQNHGVIYIEVDDVYFSKSQTASAVSYILSKANNY